MKTEAHNLRLKRGNNKKCYMYTNKASSKHTVSLPTLCPSQSKLCHFFMNKVSRFECVPLLKKKMIWGNKLLHIVSKG